MIVCCIKLANLFYYVEVQLFCGAGFLEGRKLMIEASPIP